MGDAHLNLANAYLDKGQYRLAIAHYHQALELRPNWEKAENGLAQAEAALAALNQPLPQSTPTPDTLDEKKTQAGAGTTVVLDPERTVDPNLHGALLDHLHQATIESENQWRSFLQVLEKEIEPAIKELSSCLLYPGGSVGGRTTHQELARFAVPCSGMRQNSELSTSEFWRILLRPRVQGSGDGQRRFLSRREHGANLARQIVQRERFLQEVPGRIE
jgi:hypothetical protein